MIKKLRTKFILITMSIVTVMLCIILGLIYYFTKGSLEATNISMMQNLASDPRRFRILKETSEDIRLPFFTLELNPNGILTVVGDGYYDLSDETFLMDLFNQTLENPERIGIIKEYNLRFCKVFSPAAQTIIYSDISSELATLDSLIKTCIFIGFISFGTFLGLSFLLAHWMVKPIDTAWKQQRQFVADASHELKTPLTVIMTNAELIQNPEYDNESRTKFCSSILVMTEQMRRLVEQMLELARADNVQTQTLFSQINLSVLISEAILPFEPVFFEKNLVLESEITENILVNGDAAQLRQVVDILLDNARKYSRVNGTTKVTLKRRGKHHAVLSVANEGEPIAAEDLKNLFKRFYRADKARTRDGSFGLGLSIAETIITQHNGKIWAESNPGVNTFSVELHCIT
ncbi:MAG: HAMP domain-containing histidine kinase [Bacteroidales bacterium]|nr:HAMP domain-containing histidine kinase [Lachnoclostridium sp.]MCM1383354.1 HAMP domain-containing histidine kinase [Lachnoclostridium sp.]MCM1465019.1 HAMP domain-containing histidine kinase [Bacteroidales bacterium]